MNEKLLIVCAFEPEADLLNEAGFRVLAAGIGFLRSALNLQSYLYKYSKEIDEILFVGSAGIYPFTQVPSYKEDQQRIAHCSVFTNYEITFMEGAASSPSVITEALHTEPGDAALRFCRQSRCEIMTANSVQSITHKEIKPSAEFIKNYNIPDCENMEVYGAALAALKFGKKFSSLLALTNNTGKDASSQWKKSYRRLSVFLQQELIKVLR